MSLPTTASSSLKKRRLDPFGDRHADDAEFADDGRRQAHATLSPSISPQPPSFSVTSETHSNTPSPPSSTTDRTASPPRAFPPHIHEEVLQSREFAAQAAEGGFSPSGQFAAFHLAGESMAGSESGGNGREQQAMSSPQRMSSVRSASPAKRSAADMEDAGAQQSQETVTGSFTKRDGDGPGAFDEAMAGMEAASENTETQDQATNSVVMSVEGTEIANSSATSFESEPPPAYTEMDTTSKTDMTGYTTEQLDQQVAKVMEAIAGSLDVGEKGVVVSNKWLARVMSRTSDGLKSSEYPKEAREGPIGPVDNSDIVPDGEFERPHLSDNHKGDFIPLKPGLSYGNDFSIFPSSIWGDVVALYGLAPGQHQINRYAVDTAPDGSLQTNIQYDTYPPIFTIRRVPFGEHKIEPPILRNAVEKLKYRRDLQGRGQSSPEDAPKLVASRSDRFQRFLARAKDAAGIPRATKVKVWRVMDPQTVAVDGPDTRDNGVQSPPPSRSSSPGHPAEQPATKLLVTAADFKKMDVGSHIEHIDAKDETNNDKYNGKSNLERHGLFEDQTLLLEEIMGGPAGGEFQSDGKKAPPKLALPGPKAESRPGSATPSGRTSPVPGGMLTRGRARKDGRTRGAVGLSNLGNTCYMNSALQCIRSVEELAIYFLTGKYKSEINSNNPLGHGGVMAKQYAGVLNGIYGDSTSTSFSPNDFKRTLGRLQPLFSGYGQQDSQEFLSFLVDALHEDLNRIQKKPYFENPDSDDAKVMDPAYIAELGEVYRSNHSKRNDSVCMDLFSGFYKNTMECPVCNKYSVTFDPYSLLTVQLPIESTFQHTITYVPLRGRPINHAVDIDKNSGIKALKDFIANKHGKKADQVWLIEVYNHKIYKVFEDQRSLAEESIQPNDHLFMYELEAKPTNTPDPSPKKFTSYSYSSYNSGDKSVPSMESEKADHFAVPIFFRTKGRFGNGFDYALHPLFIMLTRDEAQDFEVIIKKVLIALAQQTSRPILTEMEEKDSGDEVTLNGEADASEDSAQVSDRSVPSEDGYVEVVKKEEDRAETDAGAVPIDKGNPVPERFMHPDFEISETLRNGLFGMNYAKSSEGMLCTGMSSVDANSIRNMYSRVEKPERRGSTSSLSGESSASGATGQADGQSEESDADEDTPDLVIGGGEDAMSVSTPASAQPESDEDGPLEDPLAIPQKNFGKGKRRGGGKKRGNRRQKTYGRKDRHNNCNHRPDNSHRTPPTSQRSAASNDDAETNPYYIKLGEAIVLDMQTEGLDALFGGSASDRAEMRGHWLSDDEGKGLPFFPDPALEAKRSLREGRKKHGITLEDCFIETGKREILSADNAWYCNRCKEMRCAAKTLEIWTAPDILIVHLKRFGGNRSFRDKIDVLVDYPVEGLDLTSRVGCKEEGKSYVYDLFAVDNHYGGLGGGHYTAMAKNFNDGCWYDYNGESPDVLEKRLPC